MSNKKIRIKDIAVKAGVSAGTVDRVLHNRGEVNEETKTKILDLLKESGYQPNLIARALTSKKEYVIAVLIPKRNNENFFWQKPLKGIIKAENEIKPYNFRVENFLFEQYDEEEYTEQVQKIINLNPQGVVIAPVFINETKYLTDKLNQAQIPYIFINSDMQSEKRIRFIGQDSYTSGYVAAKLLQYGLKKKGTVLIIDNTKNTENFNHFLERNRGFVSYFNEHHMEQDFLLLKKNIFNDFENAIQQIFLEHADIVGIYVSGSKSYLTARYLEKINRKDILLIGYDVMDENIKYLESGYIDFIISQRSEEQGYLSIIQLFNYIAKGERTTEDILMPIDILIKENYKYFIDRKS
jgi:LacI family transcriptional regulator